jgi:hypothetical protein
MTELTDIQKFLSGSTLVFEANVTEDVTKFKRSDIQEITFFSQPIKLSFLTSLPDTFKPGMTYDAVVSIFYDKMNYKKQMSHSYIYI